MNTRKSTETIDQNRRLLLGAVTMGLATMGIAAAGAASLVPSQLAAAPAGDAIRPFRVHVPEEQLVDLRRRIAATRWPDQETVSDGSQGAAAREIPGGRSGTGAPATIGGRWRRG